MKVPGFKSAISNCYSGLPTVCEPPKIKIFGGNGSGGEAIPIFGKYWETQDIEQVVSLI